MLASSSSDSTRRSCHDGPLKTGVKIGVAPHAGRPQRRPIFMTRWCRRHEQLSENQCQRCCRSPAQQLLQFERSTANGLASCPGALFRRFAPIQSDRAMVAGNSQSHSQLKVRGGGDLILQPIVETFNPPTDGPLFCVDEKPDIGVRQPTAPDQPPAPGRAVRREFEYVRHGTVDLPARLPCQRWPSLWHGSAAAPLGESSFHRSSHSRGIMLLLHPLAAPLEQGRVDPAHPEAASIGRTCEDTRGETKPASSRATAVSTLCGPIRPGRCRYRACSRSCARQAKATTRAGKLARRCLSLRWTRGTCRVWWAASPRTCPSKLFPVLVIEPG
jgi:hypothetical protein